MQHPQVKGFTLIELLVVIAIIAVLAVVVVLTLNPAELLKQARDSNRISDLNTMKSAISLFLADGGTTLAGSYVTCYMSTSTTSAQCGGRYSTSYSTSSGSTSRAINGSGWLPVNFSAISSGSPVGQLPMDPINNATYFYAYAASSTNSGFKLTAHMESTRYANGGSGDVESTDGGSGGTNSSSTYDVGTNLAL